MYIFDTSAFREIFHFYPQRFPSLWENFEELVDRDKIVSVKEVLREIRRNGDTFPDAKWAVAHKNIFREPCVDEAVFIAEIFVVKHFQQSMEQVKMLKGGFFADPFVIASAKVNSAIVVTQERHKPNAVKIPNICEHFNIPCVTFEGFMEMENWTF